MLVKLEVVTAVPCKAKVLAVTVPLIAGSDAIVTLLPIVTVPEMAGSEPIVTLLPIVTDEMDTGTVPLIEAVTLPICAVPSPI